MSTLCFGFTLLLVLGEWFASVCRQVSSFYTNYWQPQELVSGQSNRKLGLWHDTV